MEYEQHDRNKKMDMSMSYGRFAAMIATSTVIMFGLMYVNSYALSHVEFSQTRTWMAMVMGGTTDPLPADVVRKRWTEPVPPEAHRLITDVDATLEEQVLHVPQ